MVRGIFDVVRIHGALNAKLWAAPFGSISEGKFAVIVDCNSTPSSKINAVFDTIRPLGGEAMDRRLYGKTLCFRKPQRVE